MSNIKNLKKGHLGESLAADWLTSAGLTVIARNWHCRYGELDLVLLDNDTVVFAEVKTRSNADLQSAMASISVSKQKKLILAAQDFLAKHPAYANNFTRFDAIIILQTSSAPANVYHLKDAFRR